MKTWLLLAACVFSVLHASAQTPVQLSQKQAVAEFPDLADPTSKLNQRFIALVNATRASDPTFLKRDDWPLILAKRAAKDLANEPPARDAPAGAPKPAGAAPTATATPTPPPLLPGQSTLRGTVHHRTDSGLVVTTARGDVWLTGFDAPEGKLVDIVAVRSKSHVDAAGKVMEGYKPAKAPEEAK